MGCKMFVIVPHVGLLILIIIIIIINMNMFHLKLLYVIIIKGRKGTKRSEAS